MRKSYYLFTLLWVGALFASCKKDSIAYKNSFEKSYQSWLNFKKSSGNSYQYTVSTGSWTGASTQTIITVKEGKIVQRSCVRRIIDPETNKSVVIAEWSEDESNLNTHSYGAATITLDDIYQKARTEWLTKKEHAKIYFESGNDGMISSCGYVDNNCVDDCFRGITIDHIEAI
jgi:hypothetical protein